jgi:hypothetical protein
LLKKEAKPLKVVAAAPQELAALLLLVLVEQQLAVQQHLKQDVVHQAVPPLLNLEVEQLHVVLPAAVAQTKAVIALLQPAVAALLA